MTRSAVIKHFAFGTLAALAAGGFLTGSAASAEVRMLGIGNGIPEGRISSLLSSGDRLYVGMAERGLVEVDLATGQGRRYGIPDGLPSEQVRSIAMYRGTLYVGTSEGVAVLRGDRWEVLREADGVVLRNVVLAASPDNREIWAAAVHLNGGLVRYDGRSWKFMGGEGRGLFNNVSSFSFFRGGMLMGAISGAVYIRRGETVESLHRNFPGANVFSVAERGGTFYAGTNKGLFLWRGQEWQAATVPDAFRGKTVFALHRSNVDLVAGGMAGLLVLNAKGEQKVLTPEDGFPQGAVTALDESGGVLYAAVENGVAVLSGWRE